MYRASVIILLSIIALGCIDTSYQMGMLGNLIYGPIDNNPCYYTVPD